MSFLATFIWAVYLQRRRESERALMKSSVGCQILLNRFFWVKAKICVLLWRGKSFTVVYLVATLASVGEKKPKIYEWRSSGYLCHGNNVCITMWSDTCQSNSCWRLQGKCIVNCYWVCLGLWYKGSCYRGVFSVTGRLLCNHTDFLWFKLI